MNSIANSRQLSCPRGHCIRVFHLINSLEVGGTETQMTQLVAHFDAEQVQVTVGCLQKKGPLLQILKEAGVPVVEFPVRSSLYTPGSLRQIFRLAVFLKKGQFQVLHTHDLYGNVIGIVAGLLARVPVIISSRRELARWWWDTPARMRLLRFLQRRSNMVIANSAAIRTAMIEVEGFPREQIRIIHNAVCMERFRVSGVREMPSGERPRQKLIAVIANLSSEVKGHHYLLQAAREVCQAVPEARFLLIGDGKLRAQYEKQVQQLGLTEKVLFLGSRNDVAELLQTCELSVLPSTAEGFPNAVLESMAAGLPVVASAVGGIPELVLNDQTGLLVPPKQPAALAAAILFVLENPERAQRYGAAALERIRSKFSFERLVCEVTALYLEMLTHTHRRIATAKVAQSLTR